MRDLEFAIEADVDPAVRAIERLVEAIEKLNEEMEETNEASNRQKNNQQRNNEEVAASWVGVTGGIVAAKEALEALIAVEEKRAERRDSSGELREVIRDAESLGVAADLGLAYDIALGSSGESFRDLSDAVRALQDYATDVASGTKQDDLGQVFSQDELGVLRAGDSSRSLDLLHRLARQGRFVDPTIQGQLDRAISGDARALRSLGDIPPDLLLNIVAQQYDQFGPITDQTVANIQANDINVRLAERFGQLSGAQSQGYTGYEIVQNFGNRVWSTVQGVDRRTAGGQADALPVVGGFGAFNENRIVIEVDGGSIDANLSENDRLGRSSN